MLLLAVLPLNGTNSVINNNYILSIRLDYLAHLIIFIPLPILMILSSKIKKNIFVILILVAAFAAFTEGLQYLIPFRTFNINDLVANGAGVGLGFLIYLTFFNKTKNLSSKSEVYCK